MNTIKLECNKCGSNRIHIADDATENTPIVCEDCGETLATFGELEAEISRQAMEYAERRAKEVFKGIPGFKLR